MYIFPENTNTKEIIWTKKIINYEFMAGVDTRGDQIETFNDCVV